jgi:hypothetical protein
MIMQSVDGQDYVVPVLVPDSITPGDAVDLARKLIGEVQTANPNDWNLEDFTPKFEAAGLAILPYFQGPVWD